MSSEHLHVPREARGFLVFAVILGTLLLAVDILVRGPLSVRDNLFEIGSVLLPLAILLSSRGVWVFRTLLALSVGLIILGFVLRLTA